jgi:hypothetical protein
VLSEWRIEREVPSAGRQFAMVMEAGGQAELDEEFKQVRRGWCLGSEEFRAEMLKYIETPTGKLHYEGNQPRLPFYATNGAISGINPRP